MTPKEDQAMKPTWPMRIAAVALVLFVLAGFVAQEIRAERAETRARTAESTVRLLDADFKLFDAERTGALHQRDVALARAQQAEDRVRLRDAEVALGDALLHRANAQLQEADARAKDAKLTVGTLRILRAACTGELDQAIARAQEVESKLNACQKAKSKGQ
jgi:hypothetical protein